MDENTVLKHLLGFKAKIPWHETPCAKSTNEQDKSLKKKKDSFLLASLEEADSNVGLYLAMATLQDTCSVDNSLKDCPISKSPPSLAAIVFVSSCFKNWKIKERSAASSLSENSLTEPLSGAGPVVPGTVSAAPGPPLQEKRCSNSYYLYPLELAQVDGLL